MGLFGTLGGLIKEAGGWVKEKCESVKNFFFGQSRRTASETSKQDAYDEELATLAETKRINKILSDFSLKLADCADELEDNVIKESSQYFDALIDELEKNNDKFNINILRIKRNKINIERKIKGSFKKLLSKRVSIDDPECLNILKLDAGKEKRNKMNNFGNKVLREAAYNLCLDIKESLLDQQEYIESCIDDKVEEFIVMQEELISKLEQIEDAYKDGKEKIDEEKNNILLKLAICELAISNLEE